MVNGNPLEEEPMTAVMLPIDPHLLERDDLTVDDLTSLPEDLRYELIDGRLVLTPSAVPLHMIIGRQAANASATPNSASRPTGSSIRLPNGSRSPSCGSAPTAITRGCGPTSL